MQMGDWTKLDGKMHLNTKTGDVEIRYGSDDWFKQPLGNIKGTNAYQRVMDTFGKKEGLKTRKAVAQAVMKSIQFGKVER